MGILYKSMEVSKQVGFKQLGPGVETGVHGVSNDDTAVAERQLEDKQLEEKTNTDCLVKKQEKEYQTGWKIKTSNVLDSCNQRSTQQCMKSEVTKHFGVSGIQQQNKLVNETNVTLFANWKAGLKDDMDARSDVYVLSNSCRKCSDDSDGYYWEYTPNIAKGNVLDMEIVRDQSGNTLRVSQSRFTTGIGSQEYQMACTRLDITSEDVGMLDKFDHGLQTNIQVFVDFDYAMGRSNTVMGRSITSIIHDTYGGCKGGYLAKRTRNKVRIQAKDSSGYCYKCLIKGDHCSEVPAMVEVVVLEIPLAFFLHAWYLDDGTIVGDTMVVGKTLEAGVQVFFSPNIARPLHGVKLLSGPASVDFEFCNELVMKRVTKTIGFMDAIAKINDPQCELLLFCSCVGISKLYFTMRTCPPCVFESAQCSFDVALRSSLERIVTASGLGFGDWQWRLDVYYACDFLNYAFLASQLQSNGLQTKLLRHTGIVSTGPNFDDAFSGFNTSMETDLLNNPSEITAPKLMKKMANIYFTRITKNAESTFSLSPRQMPLWTSQREDHTSDWLRTPCSACSKVFAGDIYGDHVVSCAGIIAGKEVDIGLDRGRDKPLHPADMLLYSWGEGLDVYADLTGSSPLTQTGMVDFVPSRAVIDEIEADAVTLLKRIQKFSVAQDIGARGADHIFNRIGFAIAKGVGAQIVSRLPSNLL
ncbi:hypothetical protein Tco_0526114 [Tanacetum coccineum]